MNIYLFLGDLSSKGGIERVTVELANGLSSFYDVTIVSLYLESAKLPFEPNEKVKIIYVNNEFEQSMYNRNRGVIKGLVFDLSYIRTKVKELAKSGLNISNDDIIISCDVKMSLLLYFFTRKSNCKIIAIEHFEHDVGNPLIKKIRQLLYKRLALVVSQTEEDKVKYLKWLPKNKHKIIPNIVSISESTVGCSQRKNKTVLAVGRLTRQKGFDLLLKAWSLSDFKDWKLRIIGEGEEYYNLVNLLNELNLSNVEILKFQNDIQKYYEASDIFVLSSRFEGLGMVLIEALAHGLACVSFDCPAGPKTIISNEQNGLLIPTEDVEKLSDAITLLINNEELRRYYQANAVLSVEKFKEKNVIAQWRELLNEI